MSNLAWIFFSLLTVGCWGVYGVFLHTGQTTMGGGELARYRAFLFVGLAYFLTAVLAPLVLLLLVLLPLVLLLLILLLLVLLLLVLLMLLLLIVILLRRLCGI